MGTIGVAGMGIGLSMGIPAPMVAGAIISGSYFGDKMSPLSDTTNLAAGLTNTDLFTHIRHMLFTTIPGLIITLIVYAFLGRSFGANNIDAKSIEQTLQVLQQNFVISPFLLIIPVVVMVLVAKKVPAIPAILVGIILGFLSQVFIQGGSVSASVGALQAGFVIDTGNKLVDELFNRGGLGFDDEYSLYDNCRYDFRRSTRTYRYSSLHCKSNFKISDISKRAYRFYYRILFCNKSYLL
ncbi:Na+/H+ antiporter NhaC [Bacillus cereus]|nr:Na+/H+ antiporter NhaC [Bacillus cereus]